VEVARKGASRATSTAAAATVTVAPHLGALHERSGHGGGQDTHRGGHRHAGAFRISPHGLQRAAGEVKHHRAAAGIRGVHGVGRLPWLWRQLRG
jgi:hypothetical protein